MSDRGDKGFIYTTFSYHNECACVLCVDAVTLLECPAVCRRPLLLIAFHFPLCRRQTREKLHMCTHRRIHMGLHKCT